MIGMSWDVNSNTGGARVGYYVGVCREDGDGVSAGAERSRVQVEVEAHVGTAGPPRVDTAHVQAVNPVGSRAHQHVVHLYLHTVGLMAVPIPLTLSMAQPLTKIVPETVAPATGVSMLTLGPPFRTVTLTLAEPVSGIESVSVAQIVMV